ncbi:DCL family protein [Corynebacterium sp. CCM 9204]|uniref:DCL family protein n=1 Tax=Corynebacterium sp. CCM 9204 TaxID=3057616 RepID=UPI0035248EA8
MSYTVGDLTFATKDDVRVHASRVLKLTGIGEILTSSDDTFARALLAHHPEASRKQGSGVIAIVVASIPKWGTRNFLVIREDWSTDNWSIKKCITNLRPDGRSTERINND